MVIAARVAIKAEVKVDDLVAADPLFAAVYSHELEAANGEQPTNLDQGDTGAQPSGYQSGDIV